MNEETIFAAALAKKTASERQSFLNEACAGNGALRSAVEELLRADADAGSFLDHPPVGVDATVSSESPGRDTVGSASWAARLPFLKPCDKPDRMGKLGVYEVIEVVGQGGMGAVLRAFDTKLSRVVAVKVMSPDLAANPTAVKRFLREATTAAAVHHDHVVTIHAVDDSHQPPYLVMEFVEGPTLQQKIDHEGPLELKHILRIGNQAAAGLAAAHKTGLIHRDVKPANILLENGVERVKISDFGLARAVDDMQVTQTGIIAGTPQYMSPEQAKGEPIDARSDLFSLGSVLYTMCTGRPAFRADNPVAALRRVCDDTPRPIREVNAEIPEWLCEIVDKLLEKEPEQRFQSAHEVADLLAQHLAHLQQPASCPRPPRLASSPASTLDRTAAAIRAEANYLWATGIMSLVFCGIAAVSFSLGFDRIVRVWPAPLTAWFFIGGLLSLPVGLTIMVGAHRVESRQSPGWAMAAAILSLLPLNPFLIFCLPITIWTLTTLQRVNVVRRSVIEQKPKKPTPRQLIIEHPVLGAVAIVMVLSSVGIATYMLAAAWHRRDRHSDKSRSRVPSAMATTGSSNLTAGRRNPFDVADVPDPDGADVQAFSPYVSLSGSDDDDNAVQWSKRVVVAEPGSLDGEWAGRWYGGDVGASWAAGSATLKVVGDRIFILHKDGPDTFLIEARCIGQDRLLGRYTCLEDASDTSPWAGRIVSPERIDGQWTLGRWDFRREIAIIVPQPVDLASWGRFEDPRSACQILRHADAVSSRATITVPGTRPFNLMAGWNFDAPRLIEGVEGDFLIEATLRPYQRPLTGSSSRGPTGNSYVGAGLLVWIDEQNLLRWERSAWGEQQGGAPFWHAEWCAAGQRTDKAEMPSDEEDDVAHLQIERRGNQLVLRASRDGQSWQDRHTVTDLKLPAKLFVGLIAQNSTNAEFSAVFERLAIVNKASPRAP